VVFAINYMKEAINEAAKNLVTGDGGPFGAVVVKDGKIIGKGHNEVIKNNDPTCHGEMQAIRDACKNLKTYDLSGCELYASAFPCPMCLSAIIWANIKTVYYGNTLQDAEDIGFRDSFIYKFVEGKCSDAEIMQLKQMDREEALKVFKEYKKNNQKIY